MKPQVPKFQPLPPDPTQGTSSNAPHPSYEKQVYTTSHVTAQPQTAEGYAYDPQLRSQYANEPGVVHATRPLEPQEPQISEELKQKHEQAVKDYPDLNLTDAEYVIMNIQRHPVGLFAPIAISMFLIIMMLSFLFIYPMFMQTTGAMEGAGLPGFGIIAIIVLAACSIVGIFGYIAVWVYLRNQFYLTNESVIQEIQQSLFSKHEQTASLGSIEDVSFQQHGIVQTMFNFGTIRLSTEGDETTYRFHYVSNPREQTAVLTNAVEAFKNGRPVGED